MNWNKFAIWSGITLLVSGGVYALINNIKLAMKYCYKMTDIKFISVSASKIDMQLNILFKNYSAINIIAKSYKFDVSVNNIPIATVVQDKETFIGGNSVSKIAVLVKSEPAKLQNKAFELAVVVGQYLNHPEKVIIELKGTVVVSVLGLPVTLPLDISMNVKDIMSPDPNADLRCASFTGKELPNITI